MVPTMPIGGLGLRLVGSSQGSLIHPPAVPTVGSQCQQPFGGCLRQDTESACAPQQGLGLPGQIHCHPPELALRLGFQVQQLGSSGGGRFGTKNASTSLLGLGVVSVNDACKPDSESTPCHRPSKLLGLGIASIF